MESPNRQAVKLLREQRKRRRRVAVFLCMAGVVAFGTVMALRMSGRAMNNQVLDCVLTHELTHQHTDKCYYTPAQPGAQKVLVCGMADFVVHKHDPEKCYDKMGNLICALPEIEEHVHTEECYQEQRVLSCTLQEGEGGHVHSDNCYSIDRSAGPVCEKEESEGHTHDENCRDEEGNLTCTLEESEGHTHDENCYPKTLTCGMEEGAGGHVHSEACYKTERTLICDKREVRLHTHTEECYLHTVDQPDQAQVQELASKGVDVEQIDFAASGEAPAEQNRVLDQSGAPILKCGQLQVLEHVHGDSCYAVLDTEGKLVSQLGSGSEGAEMPGQRTATYQDGSLRATAIYDGEDFPESARIAVERVDESAGLPEKQEQLNTEMPGSGLELKALLKVTVSGAEDMPALSEPIRLVIESQEKVSAVVWYDSGDSLADQGIFVQSVEALPELLEMTEQESGGFAAEVRPGALVGITRQPTSEDDGKKSPENGGNSGSELDIVEEAVNISQSFEYEDEDYIMTFSINGVARPKAGGDRIDNTASEPEEPDSADEPAESEPAVTTKPEGGADQAENNKADAPKDASDNNDEANKDKAPENEIYYTRTPAEDEESAADTDESVADETAADEPIEDESAAEEDSGAEDFADTAVTDEEDAGEALPTPRPIWDAGNTKTNITGGTLPANVLDDPENPLGLLVEPMDEDSAEYEMYANNVPSITGETGLPGLKVMSYKLFYKCVEMDLSQCRVTLEVTAKEKVLQAAMNLSKQTDSEAAPEASGTARVAMATFRAARSIPAAEEEQEQVYTMPADGAAPTVPAADEAETIRETIESEIKSKDIALGSLGMLNGENASTMTVLQEPAGLADDPGDGENPSSGDDKDPGDSGKEASGDHQYVGVGTVTGGDDPSFTVQYYAWLNEVEKGAKADGKLPVIDTTGGELPQNGQKEENLKIQYLTVNDDGTVKTNKVVKEIFANLSGDDVTYLQRPDLDHITYNEVKNSNYTLKQIWVLNKTVPSFNGDARVAYLAENSTLKKTIDAANCATNKDKISRYWTIYGEEWNGISPSEGKTVSNIQETIRFTNRPESAEGKPNIICITKNDVIRLVYEPKTAQNDVGASFYDYDISSGRIYTDVNKAKDNRKDGITQTGNQQDGTLYYAYTKEAGINSAGNYSGTGTKLAFGNVNTGTSLGENIWNGNLLNKFNGTQNGHPAVTGSYKGCTFGLVNGLEDGKIQYTPGVLAPNLFNDGNATGKTSYDQYSLKFNQVGDTYTLTAVNGTVATGLDSFNHPSPNSSTTHTHIWTNNFWPMDSAGSYGADGHDMKFGSYSYRDNRAYAGSTAAGDLGSTSNKKMTFPYSDDGKDHNSYFGMHFSIEFDLPEVYTGPLEYLFFGDDDMWVFLTPLEGQNLKGDTTESKLVCDIGGVHSSVGEMVNLWDYVKEGAEGKGKYRLDFFYTERGASGSTCWMQYTLPSVREVKDPYTDQNYRMLKFGKEVEREIVDGGLTDGQHKKDKFDTKETFLFELKLETPKDGEALDNYQYYIWELNEEGKQVIVSGGTGDLDKNLLYSGACFPLKHNQWVEIPKVLIGTTYTVTELGVITNKEPDTDGNFKYTVTSLENSGYGYQLSLKDGKEELNGNSYTGTVTEGDREIYFTFTNTYKAFQLPKTGGIGTWGITGAGALLMLAAGCLLARKHIGRN